MNYNVRSIIGMAILAIITSLNLNAAPSTGSQTGTSIGKNLFATRLTSLSAEANPTHPVIVIESALVVRPESVSFNDALRNWNTDWENGEYEMLATNTWPASPTNYSMVSSESEIPWWSLVYSRSTPMFAGVTNPAPPLENEHGFNLVRRVFLVAPPGQKVSLSMFAKVTWDSSDKGSAEHGSLFTETPINGASTSYTELARGYNKDGSVITSGPGDQLCDVVVAYFWDFPYNGGGTQEGLNEVKNYVEVEVPNFASTFSVEAGGVSVSQTLYVKLPAGGVPVPSLTVARQSDASIQVQVQGAYGVLWGAEFLEGPWVPLTTVAPGSLWYSIGDKNKEFFQVTTQ